MRISRFASCPPASVTKGYFVSCRHYLQLPASLPSLARGHFRYACLAVTYSCSGDSPATHCPALAELCQPADVQERIPFGDAAEKGGRWQRHAEEAPETDLKTAFAAKETMNHVKSGSREEKDVPFLKRHPQTATSSGPKPHK